MTSLDVALLQLAERQHGTVSRIQARKLGLSREALGRRAASPAWQAVTPRVLRLCGSPLTYEQRCMAAVLDAGEGAVVARSAAAHLWGLPGFGPGPIDVSRRRLRSRRASDLALLHEPRFLPEHHRGLRRGIPVTSVARTVFDLAGCLHPARAERALDNALNRNLVELEALRRLTIELVERGRTGSALMRQLLDARGAGYIPPASGLEARFLALVVAAGLELPECQADLGGDCWIGRVDFLYRRLRLVIEIDSDIHHTAKLDREADARRDAALKAAGFHVLRITEHELYEQLEKVVSSVRAALAAGSGRFSPLGCASGLQEPAENASFCRPER